ncbi:MAG: TIGR03557 family F420-dependent LLM class oxidoreductase [Candidatus Bathyarchaeota archaeon]|nr:TIGR03557 family F420-dependent LLM class oxidoreductase [Candidatus Bathyarchaeota archaeon]
MNIEFGYVCLHETHSPIELLENAVLAEKRGFDFLLSSDHFHPWMHTNAWSGFAWVWISAAAERTERAPIGTCVTPPLFRYHPALVAQAFATLGFMYPGRIFITVATGEAMNEVPLGYPWPSHQERLKRLEEAVKIIRLLWEKEFVTYSGEYFRLRSANLYTKPGQPVPLYVAAGGPRIAQMAGQYGDGLLTRVMDVDYLRSTILPAFSKGAGMEGKNPNQLVKIVGIAVTYAEDRAKAIRSARQWAPTKIPDIHRSRTERSFFDPRILEEKGKQVSDEEVLKDILITPSFEECIAKIESFIKLGFNKIYVLSRSPNDKEFIAWFASRILPYLKETYGAHA